MVVAASSFEPYRPALVGHCYRMLGSVSEADDAVQDTLVRAWKSLDRFEERASLKTWLVRIATNVCLDALADRKRRARPMELRPTGTVDEALRPLPAASWVEPIPDALAIPDDADPAEALALRQSIRLAFVTALQHLPPRQRAALLLADVLGMAATEVAECLEMTVPAVNSALQRARATLKDRDVEARAEGLTPAQEALVGQYMDAFVRYDVDALTSLLKADATLCMPPFDLWLQGPEVIHTWLSGRGAGCRGSRLLPIRASGMPAWGQYRIAEDGDGHTAWAILAIELGHDGATDRIKAMTSFLDTSLFPRFGLPMRLAAGDPDP